MKGKWAKGIAPRFFSWIIKDKLAVSERPGGYARNHRRVRRQEEILWLRGEGFTRVVSLLTSPHNLHAYDELDMAWAHIPFGPHDDPHVVLPDLYAQLHEWMGAGERLLVHQEELSDRLMGVVSGYLRWSGLVPAGPQAISVVERIMHRQMGPDGRELVAMAPQLAGAGGCSVPVGVRARVSLPPGSREAAAAAKAARAEAALAPLVAFGDLIGLPVDDEVPPRAEEVVAVEPAVDAGLAVAVKPADAVEPAVDAGPMESAPSDTPADDAVEQPVDVVVDAPVPDVPVPEAFVEVPADIAVADAPVDVGSDTPVDVGTDTPVDDAVEQPVDVAADPPSDVPDEEHVETPPVVADDRAPWLEEPTVDVDEPMVESAEAIPVAVGAWPDAAPAADGAGDRDPG